MLENVIKEIADSTIKIPTTTTIPLTEFDLVSVDSSSIYWVSSDSSAEVDSYVSEAILSASISSNFSWTPGTLLKSKASQDCPLDDKSKFDEPSE